MESQETTAVDAASTDHESSKGFTFSAPCVVPRSPRLFNFGQKSENVFESWPIKSTAFTFAAPATLSPTQQEFALCPNNQDKFFKPKITRAIYKPRVGILSQTMKEIQNSITCENVPKALINKQVAKEFFGGFGIVLKMMIKPKKRMIIITYANKDHATTAYNNCGVYGNEKFDVEWAKSYISPKSPVRKDVPAGWKRPVPVAKSTTKKNEVRKPVSLVDVASHLGQIENDEVKSELKAMILEEYNTHETAENRDQAILKRNKIQQPQQEKVRTAKPVQRVEKATTKTEKLKSDSQISDLLPNAPMEELQNIVQQAASTAEDKYKVLEARDRLMRLKQVKSHTLATAKVTSGTCPDMCPEKERLMREAKRQVALYEQLEGNDYKIDHSRAVKQYSRSSADQEEPMPHELRPVKSLKMTMSYLLHEITDLCNQPGTNLGEWYHFLWDRTRGIRKDITQQELCCTESVELVEQCARFHIVSSERLCAEESSIFDKKINSDNLTKCLQSLKYMYHDLRVKGISCQNEPEFRAYIILLNLNNGNFMWDLQRLPQTIQKSPEVQFALQVYETLESNNYYKFFRLVKKTTYLNACILLRYFNQVRLKAVSVMVKAYGRTASTAYPLYELIDILGFEDEDEAIHFCEQVGLNVSRDELHVLLNRQNFSMPVLHLKQNRAYNLIESKRLDKDLTIGECIAGGEMPEKMYEWHKPHCSFDAQGYLLPESRNAEDQNTNATKRPVAISELSGTAKSGSNVKLTKTYEKNETKVEPPPFVGRGNFFKPIISSEPRATTFGIAKPATAFSFVSTCTEQTAGGLATKSNLEISPTKKRAEKLEDAKLSTFAPIAPTLGVLINARDNTARKVFNAAPLTSKQSDTPRNVFSTFTQSTEASLQFAPTTGKSIFSAGTQDDVFARTSVPPSAFSGSQPGIKATARSTIFASNNDDKPKEVESAVKEHEITDAEKIRQKELEHKRRMQEINENAQVMCDSLQDEMVETMCLEVVKQTLDHAKLCNALSEDLANEIISDVCLGMCNTILDAEIVNHRKLQEISLRIKNKVVLKYFNLWRRFMIKRKRQREALQDTPVWLSRQTMEKCAQSLYTKDQGLVVRNMSRSPTRKEIEKSLAESLAPIEFIIYTGIKENQKALKISTSANLYWKLVVSWPDLRDKPILRHYEKTINEYLNAKDVTTNPLVKLYHPNRFETQHICIRQLNDNINDEDLVGSDALLFFASTSEETKSTIRRLTRTVIGRQKLMPIPLVFIVLGHCDSELYNETVAEDLEALMESGYLSEYTLIFENDTCEETVLNLTQSAILWLTVNRSRPNPLEINYLQDLLDVSVTEELWLRVLDDSVFNATLSHAVKNPDFVIKLHNDAINLLMDIVLHPESFMYTRFAPEFKKYLRNQYILPCSYEYLNDKWTAEDYKADVESKMSTFVLPPWRYPWPISDVETFHQNVALYCQTALPECNGNTMSSNILSNLFLTSGTALTSNFIDVLLYIIKGKICRLDENLKVIYNRNHIEFFRNLPWWFRSNAFCEFEAPRKTLWVEDNEKENAKTDEPNIKKRKTPVANEENHSGSDEFVENEPLAEFCENTQSCVVRVHHTAKEIENLLVTQQQSNSLFEQRLKNALLSDPDFVIDGL